MTPDIAESIRDTATIVAGLAAEWHHCDQNPAGYAWEQRVKKPSGVTWVAWREQTLDVLAGDIGVRVDRLYALATANVT